MVSQRSGRHPETFLEPMASLSFSMSPWRPMATQSIPQTIKCLIFPDVQTLVLITFFFNPQYRNLIICLLYNHNRILVYIQYITLIFQCRLYVSYICIIHKLVLLSSTYADRSEGYMLIGVRGIC